jgi:hypothetical protein
MTEHERLAALIEGETSPTIRRSLECALRRPNLLHPAHSRGSVSYAPWFNFMLAVLGTNGISFEKLDAEKKGMTEHSRLLSLIEYEPSGTVRTLLQRAFDATAEGLRNPALEEDGYGFCLMREVLSVNDIDIDRLEAEKRERAG